MRLLLFLLLCIGFSGSALAQGFFMEDRDQKEEIITELSVFPNPTTNGKITVKFEAPQLQEEITVKVCNLIGREVYREDLTFHTGSYQQIISIESFPKGIYLLEVSNGKEKQIRKLSFI